MKSVEAHTKRMYDVFGAEYQKTRDERRVERLYNEFLEVPCMVSAVGRIKGKSLLDVGCGAGVHAQQYLRKGAHVSGIDLSDTMIKLARERFKGIEFKVGSIVSLPYGRGSFHVVTASLMMEYVDRVHNAFAEVNRVLKKGGLFLFSVGSPIINAREVFENEQWKMSAVGYFRNKKTGKQIALGRNWVEGTIEQYEMVPGMKLKFYKRHFRTYLKTLVNAGFELVDFIDCKPVPAFKKHDPVAYEVFTKFPMFSIYVCKKK